MSELRCLISDIKDGVVCAAGKDIGVGRSVPGRKSVDILLSVPEELKERMVNTIAWTRPHTGISTQQQFIRKAMADLCDQLERDYNGSRTFEPPVVLDE
ncbi:hypothetical protein [Mycolicibacterium baixiangningiae]|uniref:hypothetical protein n=1 Tax=Mycolicibacterium baixiangningiae TaxID=2761578 RepID=UPI001D031E8E|nr:hypothetical protein [Mycolicibacterium baixiangningiae]